MFTPPYYAGQYFAAKYFASAAATGPVTCEHESHPYGHIPIGVNQPLGGSLYPFIADAGDSVHSMIADLALTYADDGRAYVEPLRLAWLYGFGCYDVDVPDDSEVSHDRDLCIVDADDNVVISTGGESITYRERAWTEHQLICEWIGPDWALQVVHATAWADSITPIAQPNYLEPVDAYLDPRSYCRTPPRMRSIRVEGQPALTGQVVLISGYNTSITSTAKTTRRRRQTSLKLDFTPGKGEGRVPADCTDIAPAIRRIAGVAPDARRDLRITATGCYTAERDTVSVMAEESVTQARKVRVQQGLRLFGNCGPNCRCEDYAAVYEALRRLVERANTAWQQLTATRELYVENRQRFIEQKQCREAAPRLQVTTASYSPCQVGVTVAYCNQSDDCVHNVVVHVSFEYDDSASADAGSVEEGGCGNITATSHPSTADVVSVNCNSVFRGGYINPAIRRPISREVYKMHGTYPHYWGMLPYIPARGQGYISFSLDIDDAECEAGAKVRLVADAYELPVVEDAGDGSPVPGYVPGSGPSEESLQYRLIDCPVKKIVVLKSGCVDGIVPTTRTTNTTGTTGTTAECAACDVVTCLEFLFPEVSFGGGPGCGALPQTRGPFTGRLTAEELAIDCGSSVGITAADPHMTMTLSHELDGTWRFSIVVTDTDLNLCPSTAVYSSATCTGSYTLIAESVTGTGIALEDWPSNIAASEVSCDEPLCACDETALPDPAGYAVDDTVEIPCAFDGSSSTTGAP